MGILNALFEVSDERLRALYHRAELEANRGYVEARKYSYLDHALIIYAREHNCSYDDALIFAEDGTAGRLKKAEWRITKAGRSVWTRKTNRSWIL